jgi:GTPase SAR1 family protein
MLAPSDAGDFQILAAMDKLRELGMDQQNDLPQIIVCGSQSAGKSSVLESLVQVPFPRSESTCTRYVTKVTLLQAVIPSVEVRIQPGQDRPLSEAKELKSFCRQDGSREYATVLGRFMKEANAMIFKGIGEHAMITQDILLINVYGPGNRPLQVLDLPGLIAYDQKGSGNDIVIEKMVTRYMAMKPSIILAVIKATEDLNNQKVLELCKRYDPKGQRTLGIITRPDVAEHSQKMSLIAVMQGQDEEFRFQHRWHVVRNRTSQEDDLSQAERDRNEDMLLNGHPWNLVDKSCRGIVELRERLRELLFTLAKKELPGLCNTFRDRHRGLQEEFEALGGDEFQEGELQIAFDDSVSRLRDAARDHSRGNYGSDIRNFAYDSAVYLRARVVDQSEVFRDELIARGQAWKTLIKPAPADPDSDLGSVYRPDTKSPRNAAPEQKTHASLKEEVDEVVQMLNQTRGTSLPTFFDPRRISNLFWRMSEGWDLIAREHIEQIYLCCKAYFRDVTPVAFQREPGSTGAKGFSNFKKVADKFVGPHIVPQLDECRKKALEELNRLEQDRKDDPINADLRFLKDRRAHHQGREFKRVLKAYHEVDLSSATGKAASSTAAERLDQTTYARHAGQHSQQDLTATTAETYLDAMWSHYLVRLSHPDRPSLPIQR